MLEVRQGRENRSSQIQRLYADKQATYFIQKANDFRSSIWIEADDRKINAKSLLGVLSMAIVTGTEVTLSAEGSDEEKAVQTLAAMLDEDLF